MDVKCCYCESQTRLGLSLTKLISAGGSEIIPISGTAIFDSKNTKICKSYSSFLITSDSIPILLTNNVDYWGRHGSIIDIEIEPSEASCCKQLLMLCMQKHTTSKNNFRIECGSRQSVMELVASEGLFEVIYKTPKGEAICCSKEYEENVFSDCSSLKSFKYTVSNAKWEREICIKRDFSEISREISRYLNRTLRFTKTNPCGVIEEDVLVSSTGACALSRGVYRAVKPSTLRVPKDSYVSALDAPIKGIMAFGVWESLRRRDIC